jgi:hypothetical protein
MSALCRMDTMACTERFFSEQSLGNHDGVQYADMSTQFKVSQQQKATVMVFDVFYAR